MIENESLPNKNTTPPAKSPPVLPSVAMMKLPGFLPRLMVWRRSGRKGGIAQDTAQPEAGTKTENKNSSLTGGGAAPLGDIRTPEELADLAPQVRRVLAGQDARLREVLAGRPDTSPDILHALCSDENVFVVRAVARNPHTPARLLEILSRHHDGIVRISVACHPSASDTLLNRLLSDNSHGVIWAASDNLYKRHRPFGENEIDKTKPSLEEAKKDARLREVLAGRPDTSPDILHALCSDENVFVVRAVARNPHTPARSLDILSRHQDRSVRISVACHPSASNALLTRLISDDSQGVAMVASRSLYMRQRRAQDIARPEEVENNAPRGP